MPSPSRVVFTEHAADRAARYDIPYVQVSDAIVDKHGQRVRNPGAGEWQIRAGRLVVVYNWPERGDPVSARVVTLWVEE